MIHVLATIHLVPNTREAFLGAFHEVLPAVRAEEGCLEYGAAVDLAAGVGGEAEVRNDVVTVIEKWQSVAALQTHLGAPHMAHYRERVKDLVTQVEIRVLEPR